MKRVWQPRLATFLMKFWGYSSLDFQSRYSLVLCDKSFSSTSLRSWFSQERIGPLLECRDREALLRRGEEDDLLRATLFAGARFFGKAKWNVTWRKQVGNTRHELFTYNPTDPFTILKLQNASYDDPELHKTLWSPDREALELWKGRSGKYED